MLKDPSLYSDHLIEKLCYSSPKYFETICVYSLRLYYIVVLK